MSTAAARGGGMEITGSSVKPPSGKLFQDLQNLGNIVPAVFTPVLAKHSKNFNLPDAIDIGLGRMQRNFEPMQKQVQGWKQHHLTDGAAKNIIYDAFLDDDLALPRHLLRPVHEHYFNPQYPEFQPRTVYSLTNAFTSALKELDPVPQFKATAKLGKFLVGLN